ncbi:TetR/AcrR family transcriptional regulator [Limosilactobacillus albertensis]|uniref:TetR/AcrR family transcriptional regulator n=1 Tax=Limosilactobacillus albertensis TaxID=2759752 RepID=A0A839HAJ9_9LACO|nr:TetR/AcrR family transcriptional regulator [Limosilactobacillus albertensis]MBB1124238.1 TetR/AcrR family transcriptional regulator [Limosilactobacillus albertensis]MCD7121969.1 TetR/AcrR family transcriptional regulator [Limosilactobacillus albertensis]
MTNKVNNKRSLETQTILAKNFLELLQEKPVSQVTVTEITKRANVNRGTFYSHYQDVYDLLEKLSQSFITDLTATIKLNERSPNLEENLEQMLKTIQRHKTVARICLNNLQADKRVSRAFISIKEVTFKIFRKENEDLSDFECELKYTFFTQGSIALILKWLDIPNQLSVSNVVQLLMALYL